MQGAYARTVVDSRVPNWRQVGKGWAYAQLLSRVQKLSLCFQGLARALSRGVRRRFVHRIT